MKRPLFVLFVDLTAAFDRIDRNWLFQTIRQRKKGNTDLIDILQRLYSKTTTALAETPDDVFQLMLGVRQGGPESPILFNLFIDYVMRIFMEACAKKNIKFPRLMYKIPEPASKKTYAQAGFHTIDWIGYADDLILFFKSRKSMQKGLEVLNHTFKRFSLQINPSKTKSMIFNFDNKETEYPGSLVSIEGKNIENTKKYLYLGSEIKYDEHGTGDAEVGLRIDSAECKFYQHAKKLFNRRILLKTRTGILNALVRSRLTYGCQTWALTEQQMQRINTCYVGMLRKITRNGYRREEGTQRFILSNNDLVSLCGTQDLKSFVARQQKKYLAHIIRFDDERIAKRLLFNNNPQHRPGRKITLMKRVLQNEGYTEEELCAGATQRLF